MSLVSGDMHVWGSLGVGVPGALIVSHDMELGSPGGRAPTPDYQVPAAQFTNSGTSSIGGALRVNPDAVVWLSSQFGRMTVGGPLLNSGRVVGTGRLNPDVTNNGVFNPGGFGSGAGGQFLLDGDYVQTAEGTLLEWVRPAQAARLVVAGGSVEIAGKIIVAPLNVGGLRVGDRYYLVDTDAPIQYSATMASQYGGLTFEPQLVAGEGLYAVLTAVPEPSTSALTCAGGAALLWHRRRRRQPRENCDLRGSSAPGISPV